MEADGQTAGRHYNLFPVDDLLFLGQLIIQLRVGLRRLDGLDWNHLNLFFLPSQFILFG